jgi:proteic killer suppression protein
MIKSFADPDTARLFSGQQPRKLPNQIWRQATRKLLVLDGADSLRDLRIPPGNRLEKLKGEIQVRINDQWRVCFVWKESNAYRVEITD